MSILNYFFMGTAFTFLVDLLIGFKPIKNHLKIKNISWGWNERITCVLFWPIAFIVFLISFIKTYFKK